jgi:membrane protease YdiL (CAAX protease family)
MRDCARTVTAIPGLTLALAGPIAVAFVSGRATEFAPTFLVHALSLAGIILIVLVVFALARCKEELPLHRLGFTRVGWPSMAVGLALTLFFVLIFGPFAHWALAQLNMGAFDDGLSDLAKLPTWYLVLTIVIIATAEELIYRAYALASLSAITGSFGIAGAISLLAFAAAHVPLWGWGPALTTLVSGAVVTLIYFWRRDIVALIIAHIATDLYGIVIAPHIADKLPI